MASSNGDSVTRRSVASQFFTQEEGPGIDGMTTSERVRAAGGWEQEGCRDWPGPATRPGHLVLLSFQVVDLLNQAALITNDTKITVLKQVRRV